MAGRKAKIEPLELIINDDFEYAYRWTENGVPVPFPEGYELFYRFKDGPGKSWEGGSDWPYVIAGDTASIRVESEVHNLVPKRTPYQLVFKHVDEAPTLDKVLVMGKVERQEP
ncbi:DUF7264 domain-containing protein [Nocardia grenadensis]|uniref:LtfC-like domain-containing protein n=1 Tax=Nocardia grenadensis TaxID=931537 RepID=UPI003D756E37